MSNTASEFLAWEETLGEYSEWTSAEQQEREDRLKALPPAEKYLVKRNGVEKYFVPENADTTSQREEISPSGKWKLVITPYKTREGAWNYKRGEVFETSTGKRVADVKRNYSSMWFLWAENHTNTGDDYLLTGEDYQGYTVCNLSRETQKSFIPDAALEGHGWCPTSAELLADGVTLKMGGCYWACPYEYRLWDFADPDTSEFEEKGFFDLTEGVWLDNDEGSELDTNEAGSMVLRTYRKKFRATGEYEHDLDAKVTKFHERAHKAKRAGDSEEEARAKQEEKEHYAYYFRDNEAEDDALWEKELYHEQVYSRALLPSGKKGKYEQVGEWKSPLMLQDEARREEYTKKSSEEFVLYRDKDLFYALLKKKFPNDYRERTARQWQSLVSRWDGDENPFYFHFRLTPDLKERVKKTATLVWGADNGPLKIEAWTQGTGNKTSEFPRTEEGFELALSEANKHLEGS